MSTTGPRLGRLCTWVVATALLCAPLTLATSADLALAEPSGPAVTAEESTASRLAAATRHARGLREQVDALELRASLAAEDQQAAATELGQVISEEVQAETMLDQARRAGSEQRAHASRRARALYMSGGSTRIAAAVLSSSLMDAEAQLGDVLRGMRAVQTLVQDDASAVTQSRAQLDQALAASSRVQELRAQRQRLESSAAEATQRLHAALDQQQGLLAEADAHVLSLAQQQREEEEQEALARAAELAASWGEAAASEDAADPADPAGLAPAPTAQGQAAIDAAVTMLGRPYEWGAVGPATFDCSGLTSWAYRQAGVSIPRTSRSQYAALPKVPLSQLGPGDLVFFAAGGSASTIHHVGIYVGGGRMLHAPRTGDVVKISAVWRSGLFGAARPASAG